MRVYLNNCVNWPRADVNAPGGLCDMIGQARPVTRETFCRNVDPESREEVEKELGYALNSRRGLTMAKDWAVGYYRSKLHGKVVYYIRWSAIEYVFA